MSFNDEITSAATEAQSYLAQMQGMSNGGTNLLLPSGKKVVATYGIPQTSFVPSPGGGYRKKHWLVATVTRDQLAAPPADQSRLVRTDVSPVQSYIVDFVGRDNVLVWEINLARFGERQTVPGSS